MVFLKGPGAFKDVNLIAVVYDNSITKNGKSHFIDVQLDGRDPRAHDQSNLHLVTKDNGPDAPKRYSNGAPYTVKQRDLMINAAGDNQTPLLSREGKKQGTIYGFKAEALMRQSENSLGLEGLIVNATKGIGASDFPVTENIRDIQLNASKAGKAVHEANKAAAEANKVAAVEPAAALQIEAAAAPQVEQEEILDAEIVEDDYEMGMG